MPTVDITEAELQALQELRKTDPAPESRGQPMPYDEASRKWGEAPPANPPTSLPHPHTNPTIFTLTALNSLIRASCSSTE